MKEYILHPDSSIHFAYDDRENVLVKTSDHWSLHPKKWGRFYDGLLVGFGIITAVGTLVIIVEGISMLKDLP